MLPEFPTWNSDLNDCSTTLSVSEVVFFQVPSTMDCSIETQLEPELGKDLKQQLYLDADTEVELEPVRRPESLIMVLLFFTVKPASVTKWFL